MIRTNSFILACLLIAMSAITMAQQLPNGPYVAKYGDNVTLELVMCKPGTFTIGSPENELGRYPDEIQREITFDKPFWIGKTEVSQQQWDAIMAAPNSPNSAWFYDPNLPIENISWFDADEFCRQLTAIERKAKKIPENALFRLPTEAEWEYACRAGTTTAFNNGKNFAIKDPRKCPELNDIAVFRNNSGGKNGRFNKTHPVGKKAPNAWGIHDMHGNVHEWCHDDYYRYNPEDLDKSKKRTKKEEPPPEPSVKIVRKIYRGGSFLSQPVHCRAAFRGAADQGLRSREIGFRIVLVTQP
jgi:formylglycine-generating enzyme required for sulfatase activity